MNILNELNEACNYIENNIENEIDIKEIARITNQSTDSINRFFVSMLGITIKEYIRKRRISLTIIIRTEWLSGKMGFTAGDT